MRIEDLQAVYLDGDGYQADVLAAFDANNDGQLDETELRLDSDAKTTLIRQRLQAAGPAGSADRRRGAALQHQPQCGVAASGPPENATLVTATTRASPNAMVLAPYAPGGVLPTFAGNSGISDQSGDFSTDDDGALSLSCRTSRPRDLYLPGHNRVAWVDIVGWLAVLGVLLGIIVHGGYRLYRAARTSASRARTQEVYMYTFYERLWHWTQAIVSSCCSLPPASSSTVPISLAGPISVWWCPFTTRWPSCW